jgi:tetratricopeptide (TPR) repeat protein
VTTDHLDSEYMIHLRRGETALAVGRPKEALREATLAVGKDPNDSACHALLARALLALGQRKEAVRAVERGLAAAPEAEHLHRLRAHGLIALRRKQPALASAREAVRLAPNFAETHWTLAMALIRMKRWDEAQAAAEEGAKLRPATWESHALLGDIAIGRRQWAMAEQHYRRSLTIEPQHALLLNALGVALIRQGNEGGLHAFRAAVSVDLRIREPKRNFWLAARGSPDLVASDWRRTALMVVLIFVVGEAAVALFQVSFFGPLFVVGPLLVWLLLIRRDRRARLFRIQEDPELRELLERVERDRQVR